MRFIWIWILTAFLIVRAKIAEIIKSVFGVERKVKVAAWKIVDAYVFAEPKGSENIEDPYFINVLSSYDIDFTNPNWESYIDSIVPNSWKSWRVELRCVKKSSKRRIVCRRGETMHFPGEVANMRTTRMLPTGLIISAVMKTPDGEYMDVTDRLRKYVINRSRKLHPLDNFPFDDPQQLCGRYDGITVRVMQASGASVTTTLPFDDDHSNISDLFW
jgi:hypothetical protein